ncbi:Cytochrome c-type biogenesis protein CcmH [Alphaproteobacteria bacterium SO-S41]|nr:Cytochrome c-type biogenesis protein CcmH [Alphaproteobacteria bacterium SO-S41]
MRALLAMLALVLSLGGMAAALEPGEALDDPALEARARAISQELRCLVCQNESIDDSAAPLARDLRRIVRERLLAGDTDAEVIDYVVARYGEYVLLRPRVKFGTWLLWFGPPGAVLIGGIAIMVYVRRRSAGPQETALSEDEERRLREIVND